MNNLPYYQLVADVSRDIVAQTAPQELPLFRSISEIYFKNPERTLREQMGKDEDLGFGVGESVTLLTPVIFEVTKSVMGFLAIEVKKSLKKESPEAINKVIKSMFRKFVPEDTAARQEPVLTAEQLRQVRQLAYEKLRPLLPEDQAGLLADSIVGSLVVAPY